MPTDENKSLRDHIIDNLRGANAHISFGDFIANLPAEACGRRIEGLPCTAWQVLEHMRIAQWDILEVSRDAKHVSPKWPEGYWPKRDEVGNAELWRRSAGMFQSDLREVENLIANSATDLFARIPHGS